MSEPVNSIAYASGKVSAVCQFCGRKGRAVKPDGDRLEVSLSTLALGWSIAPYPAGFVHRDGSTGSMYTCPECRSRLDRGQSLRMRGEERSGSDNG